jgi:D-lactate dehydrogenase
MLHRADPALVADLGRLLAPERVLSRPIDRLGRSVDASLYRLIPEVVVRPRDLDEVRGLLAYARIHRRHLTFRTAGTSLSGQALTDDILVELAPHWNASRVLDDGQRVWTQPGVVGGYLNKLLAPLGYRIGPDPASIDAAMMGGIIANNSSGMCCGTTENAYRTVESLKFLLADGTLVDTTRPDADELLRWDRADLHAAIATLRDEVGAAPELAARIRRKFAYKNTTGYSLNALIDFDRPADILAHLMIGSEGTLGFWFEATLRTVREMPLRGTALLYFAELTEAGAAVAPLAAAGAAALEIMDSTSLRSQADERRYPFEIGDRTAAILAEFGAMNDPSLEAALERARNALEPFRLLAPAQFTTDAVERETHWRLRKGLFASVGALRAPGTSVVMEDIVFPVERLAEGIADLQRLFADHGVPDTIIFGHAKDGNLHFVLAQDYGDPAEVARYDRLMHGLVDLVVGKYDGALKAEHGSGRNMAPFVRREWGDEAYGVMRRIKELLDPDGILNPGVVLNDDPELHIKNLKPLPTISKTADRCIECGFCEPRCPSRFLTLSPRQRIVVTREMTRLASLDDPLSAEWRRSLAEDFAYEGIETCAGDSMCQTSCPVKIDTGALVKELRAAQHRPFARRIAVLAAERFGLVSALTRAGLTTARALRAVPGGSSLLAAVTGFLHRRTPLLVPKVPAAFELPRAASSLPEPPKEGERRVVYFPSCLSRIIGPLPGDTQVSTARAMLDVLEAAGFTAVYPPGIGGLCCGMPFSSKAFPEAARRAAERSAQALWHATREGRDAVVTDASPCAGTLRDGAVAILAESGRSLRAFDFASFWAVEALPHLERIQRRPGLAVLHPTCTLVKSGGLPDLLRVAHAHAERVVVPAAAECCGFAGDRGFLVPELTESATQREAAEIRALVDDSAGLYSTCRTCEIGLSRAVGRPFGSIIHLVREALIRE